METYKFQKKYKNHGQNILIDYNKIIEKTPLLKSKGVFYKMKTDHWV